MAFYTQPPPNLVQYSKKKQIGFYIVGGYALIHHKMVRNTMDVDVIVHEKDFAKTSQVYFLYRLLAQFDQYELFDCYALLATFKDVGSFTIFSTY